MFKYLIVLSDDGIGDIVGVIVGVTLDKPIHEVYKVDTDGRTYIDWKGRCVEFYLHSVTELKDVESLFT